MKIIDILVNIAGNKEVPKEIKYKNTLYVFNKIAREYYQKNHNEDDDYSLFENIFKYIKTDLILNGEVEIIEEDKDIEEMKIEGKDGTVDEVFSYENGDNLYSLSLFCAYTLPRKINKLVREINKIKKENK